MSYDYTNKSLLDIIAVLSIQSDIEYLVHAETTAMIAIIVPENIKNADFGSAAMDWLRSLHRTAHSDDDGEYPTRSAMRDFAVWTGVNATKDLKRDSTMSRGAHWLLFVTDPALIDDRLRIALDAVIDVEISSSVVKAAVDIFDSQTLSDEHARYIGAMPGSDIELFFRRGRDIADVVKRLMAMTTDTPRDIDISAPRLEDLTGYGAAKDWGLELARDIDDWSDGKIAWRDVDRGILLSGPPGCGKTTFAAALARSCDVEFIAASYAGWQAAGHQGDMLKAMRRTFSAAAAKAPCILLVDEVDSFPDRDAAHGDNANYIRGVVNGFLEELDGAGGREGIVVVGACNNPSVLDPAVTRAGRLDRHVEIELPDEDGRLGILRFHLSGADVHGLNEIAQQTAGMSGADLERVIREGRRLARRARRAVELADLQASLPTPQPLSAVRLRAAAIHEIGHAVVAAALGFGEIKSIYIVAATVPQTQILGAVALAADRAARQTLDYYNDNVAMMLGGMEAERMLLGGHDGGVSSDLASATREAAIALGMIGLGSSLLSTGINDSDSAIDMMIRTNPRLACEIESMLSTQAARAREVLELHKAAVIELSELLFRHKTLEPALVYAALDPKPLEHTAIEEEESVWKN